MFFLMRFSAAVSALVLLLALEAPAFGQVAAKPVVAIDRIETQAQNIRCRGLEFLASSRDCNAALSAGLSSMLETAIVKTNKMRVMERRQLDAILREQGLAQVGLTTSGGAIGGLTGVDYLVTGTITKFGSRAVKLGFGARMLRELTTESSARSGQQMSSGRVTAEMAVDLKVTETATGEVLIADAVEAGATTGEAIYVAGLESERASADPYADVMRVVAAKISEAIVTQRYPFKVAAVNPGSGTLIVNYAEVFLAPGDLLTLYEVGESFVDPDTGEVLGSTDREVGGVEVVESQARFSTARMTSGDLSSVTVGSVLRRKSWAREEAAASTKRKRSGGRL